MRRFSVQTVREVRERFKTVLEHYENMSMQYIAIFHGSKNENL